MGRGSSRALSSVAVLVVIAASCLVVGACGSDTTTPVETVSPMEEALAGRYDTLFPDDRVQTVRIVMPESDWTTMQAEYQAEEYFRADIWFDGEVVKNVAVRTKGNSSLMFGAANGRYGLKVDFNFFNAGQTYHGVKKLSFNNGFSDPTLMKEFLGYELMALMGIPTPRACFVDLWMNEDHLGVYTQVEAVDGSFLDQNFEDGDGNLYKPEVAAGRLAWTEEDAIAQAGTAVSTSTTVQSLNMGGGDLEEIIDRLGDEAGWIPGRVDATTTTAAVQRPRQFPGLGGMGPTGGSSDLLTSVGLKTNEDRADHTHLFALLEVLNTPPAEVTAADLEEVLDVDEILRFLAVSAVLVHLDNYIGSGHNYYIYDDRGEFAVIPWDLNMCFGGFDSGLDEQKLLRFYVDEPTSGPMKQYPLVAQLLSEPEFLATYHSYLEELIDGPFSVARMSSRIDEVAALIRPYVEKDEKVSLARFEQGLLEDLPAEQGRVGGGNFIGLLFFVEKRTASIAAQLSGEEPSLSGDGSGNGGNVGIGGMPGMGAFPGQGVPGGGQVGPGLPGQQVAPPTTLH